MCNKQRPYVIQKPPKNIYDAYPKLLLCSSIRLNWIVGEKKSEKLKTLLSRNVKKRKEKKKTINKIIAVKIHEPNENCNKNMMSMKRGSKMVSMNIKWRRKIVSDHQFVQMVHSLNMNWK